MVVIAFEVDGVKRREWVERVIVAGKEERACADIERDFEDLQVIWVQQR